MGTEVRQVSFPQVGKSSGKVFLPEEWRFVMEEVGMLRQDGSSPSSDIAMGASSSSLHYEKLVGFLEIKRMNWGGKHPQDCGSLEVSCWLTLP